MEFKVWVDGIQRVVCGVTSETTCHDIIMALAHATGQTGRFTLLEKFRDNENYLVPTDRPLQILQKWGEYATDVQFLLRKSRGSKNWTEGGATGSLRLPTHVRRSCTFSGAQSGSSSDTRDEDETVKNSSLKKRPKASVPPFNTQIKEEETSQTNERTSETPESSPERIIRSPGSGSSLPSPQNTHQSEENFFCTDSFKFNREEFTRRILEKGTATDLTKFIALQKERLKLLEEESEYLDAESLKYTPDTTELDSLKLQVQILTDSIAQLADYDDSDGKISPQSQLLTSLQSEISELRMKIDTFNNEIRDQEMKIRDLTAEIDLTLCEDERLEKQRKEVKIRLLEAERTRKDIQEAENLLSSTQESLKQVDNDLYDCDEKIKSRENQLTDLERQLRSLNLDAFKRTPSLDSPIAESSNVLVSDLTKSPSLSRGGRRLVVTPQSLADTAPTINNPYGMWV